MKLSDLGDGRDVNDCSSLKVREKRESGGGFERVGCSFCELDRARQKGLKVAREGSSRVEVSIKEGEKQKGVCSFEIGSDWKGMIRVEKVVQGS